MRYDFRKHLVLDVLLAGFALTAAAGLWMRGISPPIYHPVEGITLWSLQRTAEGLPFVGELTELPLSVSSYSPQFNWLLTPVIKLFSLHSINELAIAGRALVAIFFLALVLLLFRFTRTHFPGAHQTRYFGFGLCWFLAVFPESVVLLRPDFVAFCLEIAGFSLFYLHRFHPPHQGKWSYFCGSALLLGQAFAMKFNTVGVLGGVLLFLLLERRVVRALAFGFTWLAVAALNFGVMVWLEGERMLSNAIPSTLNPPGSLVEALHTLSTAAVDLVLKNFMFYFVVVVGLWVISERNRQQGRLFLLVLATSFGLATLGQVKPGAHYNYHFGFFMLSLVPFTAGLRAILDFPPAARLFAQTARVFLVLSATIRLVYSLKAESIAYAERGHYPHEAARQYVERELPTGFLYTDGDDAQLRFERRALLSPWAEVYLRIAPSFAPFLPGIRAGIAAKGGFAAAVVTGPGCETWKPGGLFVEETKHLRKLAARFDRICIFARD